MTEENKSAAVRRMIAAGRELPTEQRLRLRELQARTDALWERRERNQPAPRKRAGTQPLGR